jgi:hypothetical protein
MKALSLFCNHPAGNLLLSMMSNLNTLVIALTKLTWD